jgi:hypothetical protein
MHRRLTLMAITLALITSLALSYARDAQREWIAGDTHIHSHWSPGYDRRQNPPAPVRGGDARYSTPMNAQKARAYGLSWMVTTDHGGPNHSKLNMAHAYAELQQSRTEVPEVLQFYGLELNMPAMDHHTLILPNAEDEWKVLFNIESQFDANEAWPRDTSRNTEAAAFQALTYMSSLRRLPVLFANHPSRSATGVGRFGLVEPRELRNGHDVAPRIYRGMEGGPGHQAAGLARDGSVKLDEHGKPTGSRGAYRNPGAGTFGGFDQMTAIVGGVWDALLGEGRHFWILATSDSHVNFTETDRPGSDFWPGQFHKTYVHARHNYDDILDGLRSGRVFVVAGDLISTLDVTASAGGEQAGIGGTLAMARGEDVAIEIQFRDPTEPNANGDRPAVARLDLIVGDVRGAGEGEPADSNETTQVTARFSAREWTRAGDVYTIRTTLPRLDRDVYIRVRGTNTAEMEPSMDAPGENPWRDLWFYSNPVFIDVQ